MLLFAGNTAWSISVHVDALYKSTYTLLYLPTPASYRPDISIMLIMMRWEYVAECSRQAAALTESLKPHCSMWRCLLITSQSDQHFHSLSVWAALLMSQTSTTESTLSQTSLHLCRSPLTVIWTSGLQSVMIARLVPIQTSVSSLRSVTSSHNN